MIFCKICSNTVCILNPLMYTRYPLIYIPNATMWLQIYISIVQCLDYVSDLDIRRVFKDDTLLRGENERFQTSNRGERVFFRFFQGLERHSWAHQTSSAGKWATPHDLLIIKDLMYRVYSWYTRHIDLYYICIWMKLLWLSFLFMQ